MKKDLYTILALVLTLILILTFWLVLMNKAMYRSVVEHKCAHWTVDQEGHAKLIWNDDGSEVK